MSTSLQVLFIGDMVGNGGVEMVRTLLPSFISKWNVDLVVVNGENAMEGKSISNEQVSQLLELGVHVITSGNHIWEKWHIQKLISEEHRLLRPANYPRECPGRGYAIVDLGAKGKAAVINLQGRTFMSPIDCPFRTFDWAYERALEQTRIVIVDMHAEATAEKLALAWYVDGRASAVIGTHTHVQTADARILPGGTAYITDAGMTGPYDSVLGMRKDIAIKRFMRQTPFKFELATGDMHLAGVHIEIDMISGRAKAIDPFLYPEFEKHV
jgi:metallophosphoesterase (TIGR00282 family)